MATSRHSLAAVLTTIATTADTLTNTVGTVNKAVGMLNTAVSNASTKQQKRSILDMATFEEELIREHTYAEVQSTLKVDEFCKQSQLHKTSFENSYKKFSDLLRPAS